MVSKMGSGLGSLSVRRPQSPRFNGSAPIPLPPSIPIG